MAQAMLIVLPFRGCIKLDKAIENIDEDFANSASQMQL